MGILVGVIGAFALLALATLVMIVGCLLWPGRKGRIAHEESTVWPNVSVSQASSRMAEKLGALGFELTGQQSDSLSAVRERQTINDGGFREHVPNSYPVSAEAQFQKSVQDVNVSIRITCKDWILLDTGEHAQARRIARQLCHLNQQPDVEEGKHSTPASWYVLTTYSLLNLALAASILLPVWSLNASRLTYLIDVVGCSGLLCEATRQVFLNLARRNPDKLRFPGFFIPPTLIVLLAGSLLHFRWGQTPFVETAVYALLPIALPRFVKHMFAEHDQGIGVGLSGRQ